MREIILKDDKKYIKKDYHKEEELENLFGKHYKQIVSEKSYWAPLKKQLKSKKFKNFKHSIGDGFLVVWDNPTTPTLYITEIELQKHDINRHILPQLGNFISFIQSASPEELNEVRNFIYEEIKEDRTVFKKIRKDTNKEVYELLDNSMEDLQILLVIDKVSAELSIGLSQIEKAINVKIRKIEVSRFINRENDEVILFTDSENWEVNEKNNNQTDKIEQYTIEYHIENKSDKVREIVNLFLKHAKEKKVEISPMKHYIGFYKNKKMIFSCIVRKNSVIFYSKAKIDSIKGEGLAIRDVRKIGHYTNHLPTEIAITDIEQMEPLLRYFDKVYAKF